MQKRTELYYKQLSYKPVKRVDLRQHDKKQDPVDEVI
jgi:hypothetical protein